MDATRAAYDEVYVYTMGRPGFILQHVVDAFGIQNATEDGQLIGVVFGLVGLYLHIEKQFSGHQVQEVHKKLGRTKRQWPKIQLPRERGSMTVFDVLAAPEGPERDKSIDYWCESVWNAVRDNRQAVIALLEERQII
jgi:hypothetical protein